jgi:hypothetical protein
VLGGAQRRAIAAPAYGVERGWTRPPEVRVVSHTYSKERRDDVCLRPAKVRTAPHRAGEETVVGLGVVGGFVVRYAADILGIALLVGAGALAWSTAREAIAQR